MKFRAEREALSDAVTTAQRAVASRTGALPVLSGLRVTLTAGSVELVGSDLELTIRVSTPAQGDGDGSMVLPARLFADILARLDADTVTVELTGDDVRIEAGRFATTLRTLAVSDFPRLPEVPTNGVTVAAAALAEALRQVVPAASKDDARPILTGVLLAAHEGGLRLVATDSYRLAMRDLPGVSMLGADQKVLVGAKGLAEVQRLLGDGEIEVFLAEREVTFRVGSADVTTRLIEGDFPNYQQLIPAGYPNRLSVSRDALSAAVNRVRLVGQSRDTSPIRMHMTSDGVELSAVAQDVGEAHESVEATFDGGELVVAFNAQFLLDGIEAVGGTESSLETIDPLKPTVMRNPESPDFLYLLMPVRIAYHAGADARTVYLASLELRDFRRYEHAEVVLGPGVTVVEGLNGAGKTTLLEAVAWVALGRSFRGVPDAALVRERADAAFVRAGVADAERRQTLEAELRAVGRNRVLVNGHPLARTRDRLDVLRVTIFAPDDLALVKGGPSGRREYLDDLLVVLAPRYEAARADYERVLRHRNALLKGGTRGGRSTDVATTLDVFDDQLARAGAELVRGRLGLVDRLMPAIGEAYEHLAGRGAAIEGRYEADWAPDWADDGPDRTTVDVALREALARLRSRELERGVTLAGPHRDEWRLVLDGLDTRSHASQGEQRCLALALRLAGHGVCRDTIGASPVLLLDDVFSELDDRRADALASALPEGQTLITTATALPAVVEPERHLRIDAGTVATMVA